MQKKLCFEKEWLVLTPPTFTLRNSAFYLHSVSPS